MIHNCIVQLKLNQECEELQHDLSKLAVWSKKWLFTSNEEKCVVLKLKDGINFGYSLNGVNLLEVYNQRDLGVLISNKLTPVDHINSVIKKAIITLHMIRCFTGLTKDKHSTLHKSIVRPVLECGSVMWHTWLKKDIKAQEEIQAWGRNSVFRT